MRSTSLKDFKVIEPLGQSLGFYHHLSCPRSRREAEAHLCVFELVDFNPLHFVELLDQALRKGRFVLFRAELIDELLGVRDVFLLLFGGRLLAGKFFFAPRHVFAVRRFVVVHPGRGDLYRAVGDVVEKGPVVRDEDH